eukprot:COSAG01_NODE_23638_length_807_cov_1.594633_1_plen_91_part_10
MTGSSAPSAGASSAPRTVRNYPPELESQKWMGFIDVPQPARPRALTAEQIRSYNQWGLIHGIKGVFSASEVQAHRERFDRYLARERSHQPS